MLTNEPKDYITIRQHLNYPAGSHCLAWREKGILYLKFDDGNTLSMPHNHYAQGLEGPLSFNDAIPDAIMDVFIEQNKQNIDEQILKELFGLDEK